MRKVLVIGSGGSGKSTFARRLGELLEMSSKQVIWLRSSTEVRRFLASGASNNFSGTAIGIDANPG